MKRTTLALTCLVALISTLTEVHAAPFDIDDLFRGGGDVIVDHPPLDSGGGASDTAFNGGIVPWQRVADDVLLSQSATVHRIVWWGYYNADNPPAQETMRVRFYGARASDGLPDEGNILFEESFLNPSRTATGRTVWVGVDPDEYIFEQDLSTPFELVAGVPYWLEIVQIGDAGALFGWQFSFTDQNDSAFVNDLAPDWMYLGLGADAAFQLISVPEPSALGLVFLGTFLVGTRRSRKETRIP